MTYRDLIQEVAKKQQIPYDFAESVVNNLLEVIVDTIREGRSVRLKRFATIKPTKRKARNRYIPGPGEVREYPATKTVKLVPSPQLKKQMNTRY